MRPTCHGREGRITLVLVLLGSALLIALVSLPSPALGRSRYDYGNFKLIEGCAPPGSDLSYGTAQWTSTVGKQVFEWCNGRCASISFYGHSPTNIMRGSSLLFKRSCTVLLNNADGTPNSMCPRPISASNHREMDNSSIVPGCKWWTYVRKTVCPLQ
mmetsp:Transcript_956/g.2572  ORF Transcript_956/g.2572 Transcript_956/m.2572 type:complete len:157 (-) Transcript_956:179-649(-)